VTKEELARAVAKVGSSASRVREAIGKSK